MRRVFVVGCPRSGTTLMQSMLGAHPDVAAFPETHALWALRSPNVVVRRLGLRSRVGKERWRALPDLGIPVTGPAPRRMAAYVGQLVAAFDAAAAQAGRGGWSEKTPGHLRSLGLIAAQVPQARVVHVVRQGVPAVTSLYAVTQDHSVAWTGARSIDLCATRWLNDLRRTAKWAHRDGHVVVAYESLVADPERVLGALAAQLQLPGDPVESARHMVGGFRQTASAVSTAGEPWKDSVSGDLVDRNAARIDRLTADEVELVRRRVAVAEATYAALPFL